MSYRMLCHVLLAGCMMWCASCATTTKVVSEWKSPDYDSFLIGYMQLAVTAETVSLETMLAASCGKALEDAGVQVCDRWVSNDAGEDDNVAQGFVSQATGYYNGGYSNSTVVVAVSSSRRSTDEKTEATEGGMKHGVSMNNCDISNRKALLDVHLKGAQTKQVYHPPQTYSYPVTYSAGNGKTYTIWQTSYQPGYYSTHTLYPSEAGVYDLSVNKQLVWSAQMETWDPKSEEVLIDSIAKRIVESLIKVGMISPLEGRASARPHPSDVQEHIAPEE